MRGLNQYPCANRKCRRRVGERNQLCRECFLLGLTAILTEREEPGLEFVVKPPKH